VDSEFIAFWARQKELHEGKHLSLILEDAEQALMARANDNRSLVQVILNYSDGMLADFLRLQIIATVNCTASDLDEALLRPGRLMARRHFGRLSRSDARRLASHHGLTLASGQEDYSLAEIFNEQGSEACNGAKILGFAA
jgi:ATP-dependent 26S proteasome regulatory subunit